jgi:hypothetical protein
MIADSANILPEGNLAQPHRQRKRAAQEPKERED